MSRRQTRPPKRHSARKKTTVKRKAQQYVLRLYVAGMTPRSTRAIQNIRRICEDHLKSRFDLQVIDIYQQTTLAEGEQIIAAPTLIKKLPLPLRRFIGDMSHTERILVGMDLRSPEQEKAAIELSARKP